MVWARLSRKLKDKLSTFKISTSALAGLAQCTAPAYGPKSRDFDS